MFGHANNFGQIASILAEHGYETFSFDFRGHGKSEGIKGTLENYQLAYGDVERFVTKILDKYSVCDNLIVGGYSYGSLLASQLVVREKINPKALVMISPSVFYDCQKLKLRNLLCSYLVEVLPGLSVSSFPFEKPPSYYFKDKLNFKKRWTVGMINTCVTSIEPFKSQANMIKKPTLVVHGRLDSMIPIAQARNFVDMIKNDNKLLIEVEDMNHFVYGHYYLPTFTKLILNWVNKI